MKEKNMKQLSVATRYILGVLLALYTLPAVLTASGSQQTDSLLAIIGATSEKERLDAYYQICLRANLLNDIEEPLLLFHAYQAEAERQAEVIHETCARSLRLYSYYNNNLTDSLFAHLPTEVAFMKLHKQWKSYYSARSLLVEYYQYEKQLPNALREARAMYQEAIKEKVDYGIGMAAYLIGSCYQTSARYQEAIPFFYKAEQIFIQTNSSEQLHNLYNAMWQAMADLHNYTDILLLVERWDAMWRAYCHDKKYPFESVAQHYNLCLLAKAHALVKTNKLKQARTTLNHATRLMANKPMIPHLQLYKEEALFAEANLQYSIALEFLDKEQELRRHISPTLSDGGACEIRARILYKIGKYQQAANLYKEILLTNDSITHMNLAAQLDNFSTLYNVDQLKHHQQQLTTWLYLALFLFILGALLIAAYCYYKYQMRRKNILLMQRMEQQQLVEQLLVNAKIAAAKEISPDEVLFNKITSLLQDPAVITNPHLERETLAQMLATNGNYIANAIKQHANMKVVEYLNKMRIELACNLIKEQENISLQLLWVNCGFSSRSTFYRNFTEQTGMSPRGYMDALKQ